MSSPIKDKMMYKKSVARPNELEDLDDSSDSEDTDVPSFYLGGRNRRPVPTKPKSENHRQPANLFKHLEAVVNSAVEEKRPKDSMRLMEKPLPSTARKLPTTSLESSRRSEKFSEMREKLTDQEFFLKILESYEKQEEIADRLFKSDEFFEEQLKMVKSKESAEAFLREYRESPDDMFDVIDEDKGRRKQRTPAKEAEEPKVQKQKEDVPEVPAPKSFYDMVNKQCRSVFNRCKNKSKKNHS